MNAPSPPDYETWRPALIAFYRRDGAPQCADNLEKFGFPLSSTDCGTIEALAAAFEARKVQEAA